MAVMDKYPKVFLLVLCLLCIFIGWAFRGVVSSNDYRMYNARAWGFDEHADNWNRIRVDQNGYVICNKRE